MEEDILQLDKKLLKILLSDKTTKEYILWGTDDYLDLGTEYASDKQMLPEQITGEFTRLIQPRIEKSEEERSKRTRNRAEVFTPSWVCNTQNNAVDRAWFGRDIVFNYEDGTTWKATKWAVNFPKKLGKTWQDYVRAPRLEVACGEAPYIVSRYDTVTGEKISIRQRVGLLDRKLRIVNENVTDFDEWLKWVKEAYRSVYGFEYQGDNLLLARENLLLTFMDYMWHKEKRSPSTKELCDIAEIIAWNIWQMDGIKCVVPGSCHKENQNDNSNQLSLFGTEQFSQFSNEPIMCDCPGCEKEDIFNHNGIYSKIMDWDKHKSIRYVDILKGAKHE
ncbi:MAG: restriction endonuclease subunit M [Bacillota bacterium]|nr:restriction endonuclease subunit M [Bacillota bacterium]